MPGGKNVATGTIALDPNTPPVLGQPLNFIWGASGLHGQQTPRVQLHAFQDVDADLQVDDLVYGEARACSGDVNALPFDPLGGAGSEWLTRGGPAHCVATLYFWDKVQGQQTFVPLATVEFDAAG